MTNLSASSSNTECPTIYVSVAENEDPRAYIWVEIGAEEEGVPCRQVTGTGHDPVALALAAAQGSRLGVGVGVAGGRVALQEAHMPPDRPVLIFETDRDAMAVCRLMGSNAGRMVKRMPLRLSLDLALAPVRPESQPSEALASVSLQLDTAILAATIARALKQRGVK